MWLLQLLLHDPGRQQLLLLPARVVELLLLQSLHPGPAGQGAVVVRPRAAVSAALAGRGALLAGKISINLVFAVHFQPFP